MMRCTLTQENMETLSTIVREKNELSLLHRFTEKTISEEERVNLNKIGFIDEMGNLMPNIRPTMSILSNPSTVVNLRFTGGASVFEHCLNYDETFHNHVTLTVTSEDYCIDDYSKPDSILKILRDFIGISNIKSINISGRYCYDEAIVLMAILDIERRALLRSFIDELPTTQTSFNLNMIWRITNSTNPSIQWFVSIINEIIDNHETITLNQIQKGIDGLSEKGILVKNGDLYQCAGEMAKLSGRMIIIDNVLSTSMSMFDKENKMISKGFTCIQSGVHDLLFIDNDGSEIIFETITSVSLLDCLDRFMKPFEK